jgi:hypothetical protein
MIENFKLKVFRVVADNLNYRRADFGILLLIATPICQSFSA